MRKPIIGLMLGDATGIGPEICAKLLGFNKGVTVTAGLKTVFTTPAHGTAFDIVGIYNLIRPHLEEENMKVAGTLLVLASLYSAAYAAEYPTKPIRFVVGFAPGGGTDTTARAMANKLTELLGQQVVVDNRPGAAGNIATEIVAKASPDGYTVLMGTIAALAINPSLYGKLPFDPIKDFQPVTLAVDSTNVLVLHPSVPAKSVQELIALAKSKPLNGGSSGVGGTGHLALELFNTMAGTKITHVPYKGGGPAIIDLVAGNIHLIFSTAATAVPHMKAGRIKGIAVTTAKRSALLPDLPTVAEAGLKGYETNNWYGVLVPAKTPRPIVNQLNSAVHKALSVPEIKQFLFNQGLDANPGTPEQFGAHIKSEGAKWAQVVKASGAKAN